MAYSEETTFRNYVHLRENYLQRELYEIVKKDEKVFDFIQDTILDGVWFWDLKDPDQKWMDEKFWSILGYTATEIPKEKSFWKKIIIQEDLEKILKSLDEHLDQPNKQYDLVVRFTHKLGHIVWLRCRGITISDINGEPLWMIGVYADVTKLVNTEYELQQQVEKYKDTIESTNSGSWEWNLRTGKVVFDERWANTMGYSLSELQPVSLNTWVDLMHPSDHIKSTKVLQQHYEKLIPYYECETRLKHKNGDWIWALIKGKIVSWDEEGNPELLVGTQVDITENKKALEKNRLFVSQAPSAIAMFDTNMRYLAASSRWFEDYNIVGQDIIGKSQYEVFPDMKEKWESIYNKCLNGETLRKDEDCLERNEGCNQWISWELRPWYNKQGQIGGLLKHTSDISKLKKAEELSEERKVFLEAILDSIDVGVVSCDDKGLLTLFNKTAKKWHGLQAKPISPSDLSEYYGLRKPDGITPLKEEEIPLIKALRGNQVMDDEIVITSTSSKQRHVVTNGSQLIGVNGEVRGAVVAMHDVTDRKLAEEKLKISEQAFRGNFESAATGMAIIGLDGRWIEVNDAVCNMIGYRREELTNMTFQDITHPEDLNKDLGLLNKLLNGEISFYHLEKRYFHKNGREVHGLLSVSLVRDKKETPLYFISQITDTTQSVYNQRRLEDTLAKLKGILESSSRVGIIGTDVSGIITTFNKGAENLLGYDREEMLYKQSPVIIHDQEEVELVGRKLSHELHKEVKGFDVFIELTNKKKHYTKEWTYIRKDGTRFPVQLTVTAIKERDKTIGYLGVATDISDIKKVEDELKSILELTEEQNERLRNFAYIVSHNLKSQSGNFEMLLDIYTKENPEAEKSEAIQLFKTASTRLSDTIKHLNEVVQINNSIGENLTSSNLKKSIDEVVKTISVISKDAEVTINNNISEELWVQAIPAYLDSIILNFITNGIRYRSKSRDSYINIEARIQDDFIVMLIEDNGLGIDLKKYGSKLFGMYKTFHNNEDARGIGLFITKNQVEALGGKIKVKSKVDQGTTFEIYLKKGKQF
ncbi:PAS domain S-box protein [uncultured Aquimarina sp.]|uniref:PAS domain S-box protein n=1 Tax=uncultured Aquimarina sp. TaxID=575652 RepID=UPI002609A98C|nr:PAS domain S-box protein [uncultured Aquimarina sp.]